MDAELWREWRKQKQHEGEERRERADHQFDVARRMADASGLSLVRCSDTQYNLRGPGWLMSLYPGNGRIFSPDPKRQGPYMRVPRKWTLLDVVMAAAGQDEREDTP